MVARVTIALVVALSLVACGVKTDLELPKGAKMDEQRQPDPSRPPVPLGQ